MAPQQNGYVPSPQVQALMQQDAQMQPQRMAQQAAFQQLQTASQPYANQMGYLFNQMVPPVMPQNMQAPPLAAQQPMQEAQTAQSPQAAPNGLTGVSMVDGLIQEFRSSFSAVQENLRDLHGAIFETTGIKSYG